MGMAETDGDENPVEMLSRANSALVQKMASPGVKNLSAAEVENYVDRADLYRQKLDLAVANGDIDPTIAADLKAKIPADPKSGGVFLLSRANENGFDGRPIDFILGLFNGKQLFKTKGERTGVQHLSRAVPDNTAASAPAPKMEDNPVYQTAVRMGLIATAEPK
jgi:hypothetical protein